MGGTFSENNGSAVGKDKGTCAEVDVQLLGAKSSLEKKSALKVPVVIPHLRHAFSMRSFVNFALRTAMYSFTKSCRSISLPPERT